MAIILTKNFSGNVEENFVASVAEQARSRSHSGKYELVYIVPTRRRVRELQRELIENVAFGKSPVYTLELFAHEIFLLMKIGRRMISPSMQGMIVGKILFNDNFKFFRYSSFHPAGGKVPAGTIKKIVDQIDYLRENGISSEDYEKMLAATDDSERQKLEEFLRIYKEYEESLDVELIDGAGLLSLVNSEMINSAEIINKSFPNNLTFFVEGFYNFKKPELELLKILSSRKDFSFLVKVDCIDTNANLFRTMIGTMSDLMARGFKKADNLVIDNRQSPVINLRECFALNLFSETNRMEKLNLKEKVFVVSVRDKLREVEFVAEKVKEVMKNNPVQKLDCFCVASYLPQNYSQIVREVFAKYQIPANVTDRHTLESNNVVNAILSFIDIKSKDYERGTMLRAITNRVLTISDEMSASEAGGVLYNAAALCRFERGLRSFREMIASRLGLLGKLAKEESDENEMHRDAEALAKARKLLDRIEKKLAPFKKELTPGEFRSAIKSLVSSLNIYGNIARMNVDKVSTEIVERDARALSAFFEVLDEFVEMETRNDKMELDILMENLRAALSLTRYNVRQKHGYGVYVTALEEIRGLEFDYIFIVGLNEGEFPTRYAPEIFLPLGSQKENREKQPYLQRHVFYQAVCSFNKNLFLISAERTDDVHLLRSSFVDEFIEIADPSFIHETETDKKSDSVSLEQNIYNIQQLIELNMVSDSQHKIFSEQAHLLPSNVARCKAAELERYKGNKESEFNGKINQPELIDSLSSRFADKVFSSAQIESLSRCGFQYFARRILQIAEIPDIETSLSAIERGAVLHKILFRFYNELSHGGKLDNAKDELKLLLDIGQRLLDELGIEHDLFELEKETILGNENIPGTLELFLTKVQTKLSEYGFHPKKFELGFGMKDGTDEFPAVKISDVSLRGKIDRIDSDSNRLSIFDYKTSSIIAGHKDVVGDRISPQLILYLNALNQITSNNDAAGKPVGAAFLSINRDKLLKADDGKDVIQFVIQTENGELRYNPTFGSKAKTAATENYPKTMAELLKQTESFVEEKVSAARGGHFNLTKFTRDRVCTFCSYSEACRIALRSESFSREESK